MNQPAKHTAEPWKVIHKPDPETLNIERSYVATNETTLVAKLLSVGIEYHEREANAARICACVNACAGISDPVKSITNAQRAAGEAIRSVYANMPLGPDRDHIHAQLLIVCRALGV